MNTHIQKLTTVGGAATTLYNVTAGTTRSVLCIDWVSGQIIAGAVVTTLPILDCIGASTVQLSICPTYGFMPAATNPMSFVNTFNPPLKVISSTGGGFTDYQFRISSAGPTVGAGSMYVGFHYL